jgi:hypothetical protein
VLALQTGIEPQNAVDRLPAGQQTGDGTDGDADAADAGLTPITRGSMVMRSRSGKFMLVLPSFSRIVPVA